MGASGSNAEASEARRIEEDQIPRLSFKRCTGFIWFHLLKAKVVTYPIPALDVDVCQVLSLARYGHACKPRGWESKVSNDRHCSSKKSCF